VVRPSLTYVLLRGLALSLLLPNHQHLGRQHDDPEFVGGMRPVHRSRHEITVPTRIPEPSRQERAKTCVPDQSDRRFGDASCPPDRVMMLRR
jgi:hypothetical protein